MVDRSKWIPEEFRRVIEYVTTLVIEGMGKVDGSINCDTTILILVTQ